MFCLGILRYEGTYFKGLHRTTDCRFLYQMTVRCQTAPKAVDRASVRRTKPASINRSSASEEYDLDNFNAQVLRHESYHTNSELLPQRDSTKI